jgi:hypothetical protein
MLGGRVNSLSDVDHESVVELPLATRDALVHLLLADLGSLTGAAGVLAASHALQAHSEAADPHSVLASAGLMTALDRVPRAGTADMAALLTAVRARLRRYSDALAHAPRGIDLDTRLAQARALLAHALFFEVHEVLEPPWRAAGGDERRVLQGLIQAAVAWHHGARGRSAPALRAAAAASAKLADAQPLWRGFPIAALRAQLDAYRATLTRGAPDKLRRVVI